MKLFSQLLTMCLFASPTASFAQARTFDLTQKQPVYSEATGYGYDVIAAPQKVGQPFYFSVRVSDGNYRVSVVLGSKKTNAITTVRAESRRLMVENCATKKRQQKTYTFIVNKRSPKIDAKHSVRLKPRERGYLDWDDRLTLEFNGVNPSVSKVTIEPDTTATTVFLCGNSTVVDQSFEPWASWGQMITRWFGPAVAISNPAESGLTAGSFLAGNRLDKVLAMMRKGDHVICEFVSNNKDMSQLLS